MARPLKEGMDYFPHDVNASTDKKIEALRALHGNDGYAFYFIMLEQIYQEPNFELNISDAETKEETILILSKKIGITKEKFNQVLNTALKWGCFDKQIFNTQGILTSNGVKKRSNVVTEKRDKMRDKYQTDKQKVSDAETKEETPQSKVKKIKEKKSNTNQNTKPTPEKISYAEYVYLTKDEYDRLINEFGESDTLRMIEILDNYIGQNPKKNNRYTDHNRTIRGWVLNKHKEEKEKLPKEKKIDYL